MFKPNCAWFCSHFPQYFFHCTCTSLGQPRQNNCQQTLWLLAWACSTKHSAIQEVAVTSSSHTHCLLIKHMAQLFTMWLRRDACVLGSWIWKNFTVINQVGLMRIGIVYKCSSYSIVKTCGTVESSFFYMKTDSV